MAKKSGRHSSQANDFLEPYAPINVSASDIGAGRSYNNGAVTVSFSMPADSPAATSYTATASTGQTATGASSPLTISGISSGANITVTVVASNAIGLSPLSLPSAAVTVTTVPATPSAPSVNSPVGQSQDVVSWTAPSNGGKAITGYDWQSNDGKSGNINLTSVTVNQEAGTSQQYRVYATNENGSSEWSAYSATVTTFSFTPFAFSPYYDFSFTPFAFSPYYDFSFTPFAFSPYYDFSFTPFAFSPYYNFGFTPFAFAPYYDFSFTPFGFTPFNFTPFSFTPFGFTPFNFTPFSAFGFVPFSFIPFGFVPFGFTPFNFTPKR